MAGLMALAGLQDTPQIAGSTTLFVSHSGMHLHQHLFIFLECRGGFQPFRDHPPLECKPMMGGRYMEARGLKWVAALVIWAWAVAAGRNGQRRAGRHTGHTGQHHGRIHLHFLRSQGSGQSGRCRMLHELPQDRRPSAADRPGRNHYVLLTGEHEVSLMTPERYEMMGLGIGDFNLYRYVQNDPANAFDPTGEEPITLASLGVAFLVHTVGGAITVGIGGAVTGGIVGAAKAIHDGKDPCLGAWKGMKHCAKVGAVVGTVTGPVIQSDPG
jgi:hypothetical protein